jgi:hypothetical protein
VKELDWNGLEQASNPVQSSPNSSSLVPSLSGIITSRLGAVEAIDEAIQQI